MKGYVVPFVLATLGCAAVFFGLDLAIMKMQGLDLIFRP
jgi:hypothetical protein